MGGPRGPMELPVMALDKTCGTYVEILHGTREGTEQEDDSAPGASGPVLRSSTAARALFPASGGSTATVHGPLQPVDSAATG